VRQTPLGLMQETVVCSSCNGAGQVFKDKEKCKKCKGNRVVQTRKILELYIPRGSRQGDKIVLQGEADQVPDQEPGDIIFELKETDHEIFARAGNDLAADVDITLVEALTGFSRVLLTQLDGRGISITPPKGKILRPGQVLKIAGEGMPVKKSDAKGDLYLTINVEFPEDGFFIEKGQTDKIRDLLPGPAPPIQTTEVDDVPYEEMEDLEGFGAGSDDPRAGANWEDDEDEMEGGPQCAQQ
jgi:DnaJ family protein A protein 2